ncbi:hypothetical protein M2397_003269 [Pseudomonas sp. BIGb0381]|uniref:hypothetical protein n=1 Tax=Pseudomonas sp. BIGb0381 TaxID=2940608 RepID=UPI00216A42AF|nr:hypothetical protein [Pseudomonas sp. BIGb0381]MCS4312966.1 hypothetical protein [Pseudomonas sp. BIGb0381]
MSEGTATYSAMIDVASKTAAAVGVLLGIAYAVGFFSNLMLYSELGSHWVIALIDLQGMIKDGLPFVMLFLIIMIVLFCFLRSQRGGRYLFISLCFVICLTPVIAWFTPAVDSEISIQTKLLVYGVASVGILGMGMLSWGLHAFIEHKTKGISIVIGLMGMALSFSVAPALVGYLDAKDLKFGREKTSVVFNEKNEAVGLLVKVVGGKFLIMDCLVLNQLWLEEVSSKYKVRKASGLCNPQY